MQERLIGVSVVAPRTTPDSAAHVPRTTAGGAAIANSINILARIQQLERLGIPAAWLTQDYVTPDDLTLYAAAALQTNRIKLGTCVIPIWPRHPIAIVQQVQVVAQLAPGRLRLGVGPSHQHMMQGNLGFEFRRPLTNLREYVHIVKKLLHEGAVDFDGYHYRAHARIAAPVPDVPVMASALQPKSFELCGEVADGAISWRCPAAYLRDVALPALKTGAEKANHPAPPLIAHALLCVHDKPDEVRKATLEHLPHMVGPQPPFYARMLTAAGYPGVVQGIWSDSMFDDVVLYGGEAHVADRIKQLFVMGASEVVVTPVAVGPDRAASQARTLRLLAEVAKQGVSV